MIDPRELMRKAKEGDAEAFGKLYEQFFVPVFRYIYLRVKDREAAEDLTQEVFIKVFQSVGRFDERGKAPLAFFFTTARNLVIDSWRKKKTATTDLEKLELQDLRPRPDEVLQNKEATAEVMKTLKDLPDEQQEVLVLKFINELSNKEIAVIIQKSEQAVRQIQCRGLKALRRNKTVESMR